MVNSDRRKPLEKVHGLFIDPAGFLSNGDWGDFGDSFFSAVPGSAEKRALVPKISGIPEIPVRVC